MIGRARGHAQGLRRNLHGRVSLQSFKQFVRSLQQAVARPCLDTVAGVVIHKEARQPSSAPVGWQTRRGVRDATWCTMPGLLQEPQQYAQIGICVFQQLSCGGVLPQKAFEQADNVFQQQHRRPVRVDVRHRIPESAAAGPCPVQHIPRRRPIQMATQT